MSKWAKLWKAKCKEYKELLDRYEAYEEAYDYGYCAGLDQLKLTDNPYRDQLAEELIETDYYNSMEAVQFNGWKQGWEDQNAYANL